MDWFPFIQQALREDVREGDHTTQATIGPEITAAAKLKIKDTGILAGVDLALAVLRHLDPSIQYIQHLKDGAQVSAGDTAFEVLGNARAILSGERLLLNCMQRMSGIATLTHSFVSRVKGTGAKILDTRKTTPLFRDAEKWAVRIGGGENHRSGLYDMILIKDNHIDVAGGIKPAIRMVREYLQAHRLELKVEVETRSLEDVLQVMEEGGVDRIMLDNFSTSDLRQAIRMIPMNYETEASGGITLEIVREVAETGVQFISVGALTHSYRSLDLSLKVVTGRSAGA